MQAPLVLTRKQPCPCGSGASFGTCCAPRVEEAQRCLQRGAYPWLSGPDLKFLALAAGIAPGPGEEPPGAEEMLEVLENLERRVFSRPTEQQAVQAGVHLIFGLTRMSREPCPLQPALDLISPQETGVIIQQLDHLLEPEPEPELEAPALEELLRVVLKKNVGRLLDQIEVELLPWRLAQALRQPGLSREQRGALILALTHAVEDERDPLLWEVLFLEALRRELQHPASPPSEGE